jgi:Uri superfamily endonuclease
MSKKNKALDNAALTSVRDALQAALQTTQGMPPGRQITFTGGTPDKVLVMPNRGLVDRVLALRNNVLTDVERQTINLALPCFEGKYVEVKAVILALTVMIRHVSAQLRGDALVPTTTAADGHLALDDGDITSPSNLDRLRVGFIAAQRAAEETELFVALHELRRHLPNPERLTELFGTVVTDDWYDFVASTMASLYEGDRVENRQMKRALQLMTHHIDYLNKRAAEAEAHKRLVEKTVAEATDLQNRIRALGGTTPTIDRSRLRHSGDCGKLIRELRQQHDELLAERRMAAKASAVPRLDELRREIERLGGSAKHIDESVLRTPRDWEDAVEARKNELATLQKQVATKPAAPNRPKLLSMFMGARNNSHHGRPSGAATGS